MPSDKQLAKPALRKGERTRAEIMEAARRAFKTSGYLKTEMADIAREAGKSVGVLYIYFRNKADLLNALVEEYRQQVVLWEAGSPTTHWTENWESRLRSVLERYKANQSVLAAVMQASMVDENFMALWRSLRASGLALLARTIREMQADGKCAGLDPELAASALLGMMQFSFYNWLSAKLDFPEETVGDDAILETFSQILNGTFTYRRAP